MTRLSRRHLAEPAVVALGVIACGAALGLAGALGVAPIAGTWLALGVASGYALSGST